VVAGEKMNTEIEDAKEDLIRSYNQAVLEFGKDRTPYNEGIVRGLNIALCAIMDSPAELHKIRIAADEAARFYVETRDGAYRVSKFLRGYGGGFEAAIGHALEQADTENAIRIRNAFPDLWGKYANITD